MAANGTSGAGMADSSGKHAGIMRKARYMFGPISGLGKKYAIINGDKFHTVENLFAGIQEQADRIPQD